MTGQALYYLGETDLAHKVLVDRRGGGGVQGDLRPEAARLRRTPVDRGGGQGPRHRAPRHPHLRGGRPRGAAHDDHLGRARRRAGQPAAGAGRRRGTPPDPGRAGRPASGRDPRRPGGQGDAGRGDRPARQRPAAARPGGGGEPARPEPQLHRPGHPQRGGTTPSTSGWSGPWPWPTSTSGSANRSWSAARPSPTSRRPRPTWPPSTGCAPLCSAPRPTSCPRPPGGSWTPSAPSWPDRGRAGFTRRELRDATGFGDTQLKVHLARLVDLEYVVANRAGPATPTSCADASRPPDRRAPGQSVGPGPIGRRIGRPPVSEYGPPGIGRVGRRPSEMTKNLSLQGKTRLSGTIGRPCGHLRGTGAGRRRTA